MSCNEILGEGPNLRNILADVPRGRIDINVLKQQDYVRVHQEKRILLRQVLNPRKWFALDDAGAIVFPPDLKGKIIVSIRHDFSGQSSGLIVYGGLVTDVRLINQDNEGDLPTFRIFLETPEGAEEFNSLGLIDVFVYVALGSGS